MKNITVTRQDVLEIVDKFPLQTAESYAHLLNTIKMADTVTGFLEEEDLLPILEQGCEAGAFICEKNKFRTAE